MPRNELLLKLGLAAILTTVGVWSVLSPAPSAGQQAQTAPAAENPPGVIKTESNLVLLDVVAVDKKGQYITDLEQNGFRVYQDDKEQAISSFSRGSGDKGPGSERYIILFFDDADMTPELEGRARGAAAKFIDGNASPHHLMAALNFGGMIRVTQNFTADANLLKAAVTSPKFSGLKGSAIANPQIAMTDRTAENPQIAMAGAISLASMEGDFAARNVLLALREVAKSQTNTPGRKSLVFFSPGFLLSTDRRPELTATIDALNKANIAVYPVDVSGVSLGPAPGERGILPPPTGGWGTPSGLPHPGSTELYTPPSPFAHLPDLWASMAFFLPDPQHGGGAGGGGAGGGGAGGGGAGGGAGGRGVSPPPTPPTNPGSSVYTSPLNTGSIIDEINQLNLSIGMENVPERLQVLYLLAGGTGGFEIVNTNDYLKNLEKIAQETDEYYSLGYTPPDQMHDGSFHKIKITVKRRGIKLRYRPGYFDVKSPDLLKGTPEGKALEARLASSQPGDIPISVLTPYFYPEPGVAGVDLALSVPGSSISFEKRKGEYHSEVQVLGIAYRENGSIAARFSDTLKLDYDKKTMNDVADGPWTYKNTFKIAPGMYTLKLAVSSGEKLAKYESPFYVQPFNGAQLGLAGPTMGDQLVPVTQVAANMDTALMEDHHQLIFDNMKIIPSAAYKFAKTSQPVVYVEVYDPALKTDHVSRVGVEFEIVDQKTHLGTFKSPPMPIDNFIHPGNPLVPIAFKLPIGQLQAGNYRVEVMALEEGGKASSMRSADFTIE